jgi:hypothetical protein
MPLLLKTVAALGVAWLVVAASPAYSAETATPNDTARFIAGLPPAKDSVLAPLTQDPAWQHHAQLLNSIWADLEQQQLSRVRAWSRANVTSRRPVTYYFFSGPDFLYADAFLPNASTYILAGLELIGPQPDVQALRPRFLANSLESVRRSISTLLSRSYFITSYMGSDLNSGQLRGTLPILYVFLARTGKTIHEVSFVTVKQDGSVEPSGDGKDGTRGVKIVFSGADSSKKQTLYYFRTDLSNKGVQASGFLQFCRQFGIGDIFIKAASYLLHTPGFSIVRDFLLGIGATVVQDDTGVPLRYFEQSGWQVRPFGRYVGPIPVFRGNYQAKLKTLFEKANAPPIDFGIGYRWRTNESHVLLANNPNPQVPPGQQATGTEKMPQEQPPATEKSPPSAPATPPVVRADKAAADKPVPNPPPPQQEKAAKQRNSGAGPDGSKAPQPAPSEASRFTTWPSLLFGGLFSAALVALFGLEGVATGLGFLLQATIIGAIAWLAIGFFRARDEPAAVGGAAMAGQDRTTHWRLTETDAQDSRQAPTKALPLGLAERLRRWTAS